MLRYVDEAVLSPSWKWLARTGAPIAAILIPAAFFLSVAPPAAKINRKLYAKLEALDDERLAQPAQGFELPHAKTIADQLAFFALHDAYHVGQMGFVRKALGYPGLAG